MARSIENVSRFYRDYLHLKLNVAHAANNFLNFNKFCVANNFFNDNSTSNRFDHMFLNLKIFRLRKQLYEYLFCILKAILRNINYIKIVIISLKKISILNTKSYFFDGAITWETWYESLRKGNLNLKHVIFKLSSRPTMIQWLIYARNLMGLVGEDGNKCKESTRCVKCEENKRRNKSATLYSSDQIWAWVCCQSQPEHRCFN